MNESISAIKETCHPNGLDLSATAAVGDYNRLVAAPHRLPGDAESTVLLLGNTRHLWPVFLAALRADRALLGTKNPLDRYIESVVIASVEKHAPQAQLRWAHKAQPHHVSFQTLSEVAGLAWRSPACLSVHPEYGPWIALRAAVVFPQLLHGDVAAPAPKCLACEKGCELALHRLNRIAQPNWRDLLAMRDACPVGQQHRYSDAQIQYHYTHSAVVLQTAMSENKTDD